MAPRQEAERELQVRECARVAGFLHLASSEEMQSLVVPHLECNDVAVDTAGEREPPADILVGEVHREQKLESPSECRRRGRVSVSQADRERVEQHVNHPWWNGAAWRRPRGGRDRRRAADDFNVIGHGAPQRLEVRLAS